MGNNANNPKDKEGKKLSQKLFLNENTTYPNLGDASKLKQYFIPGI